MKDPIWQPTEHFIEQSNITQYKKWLATKMGLKFTSYHQLWQWSVDHIEDFWKSIWTYFDILHDGSFDNVMSKDTMPGVKWFEGTQLNYAEHVFSRAQNDYAAILHADEQGAMRPVSWNELIQSTAACQCFLETIGIVKGDAVVGYMPCCPEATMAFLATNGLGAIWSSCSPDFGVQSVIDRFAQIQPKVMVAVDEYIYGGKKNCRKKAIEKIAKAIPSIKKIILISSDSSSSLHFPFQHWDKIMKSRSRRLRFVRVDFNHPMWVLYSSGTTGLPKAIVHSQGGMLLEQLKYHTFHHNAKKGETYFWYTTTGWMMWNHIQASLLCGGIMITYDGSPSYPNLSTLWKLIQDAKINHFGTSAGYILATKKANISPQEFDLTSLQEIGSTGSTLPSEGFEWVYKEVKPDVWLTSMSGGTDVCTAFVGGNPTLPVYEGEIQCAALGCALQAWDKNGKNISQVTGEMVITKPMPSMPIYLWGDTDNKLYKKNYFDKYPKVWRHGDWIAKTAHEGIVIYGRSDATLNRGGVRIGTSEIYRAVDIVEEVIDSIIVCIEKKNGNFYMPLFVMLKKEYTLSDALCSKIKKIIRENYSPRHVPDEIIYTPDIPYTISGKKTEMPIKKIFMGNPPEKVVNTGVLRNPDSIKFYIAFYSQYLKKITS